MNNLMRTLGLVMVITSLHAFATWVSAEELSDKGILPKELNNPSDYTYLAVPQEYVFNKQLNNSTDPMVLAYDWCSSQNSSEPVVGVFVDNSQYYCVCKKTQ